MTELYLTDDWPPERMWSVWPQVQACLQKVCDEFPAYFDLAHLVAQIMAGEAHLWVAMEDDKVLMAFTVEERTIEATGKRIANLAAGGGERGPEIISGHLAQVEEWARNRGADIMEMTGRAGWRRLVQRQGYDLLLEISTKAL